MFAPHVESVNNGTEREYRGTFASPMRNEVIIYHMCKDIQRIWLRHWYTSASQDTVHKLCGMVRSILLRQQPRHRPSGDRRDAFPEYIDWLKCNGMEHHNAVDVCIDTQFGFGLNVTTPIKEKTEVS